MVYEKIDPLLDEWARANNLRFLRKYQGADVRSVDIVDTRGQRYQIWIDVPDMNGLIGIHVWDYRRPGRRRDFIASSNDLTEYLNSAVKIAKSWSGT